MIPQWLRTALLEVLRAIGAGPPKDLISRLMPDAKENNATVCAADLTELLVNAPTADPILNALGRFVQRWDAERDADWTEGTPPSTETRRILICRKLGLDDSGAAALLAKRPIYIDHSVVISSGEWQRWYTPERASAYSFYWPHYSEYLLKVRNWPGESVTNLDLATTRVVERLADPEQIKPYRSKGLVVGYVQSGKTANFTGVIAKSIDVGYRLVIVMTGTIEMLRGQTQRRIDMEMVGKRNIIGDLTPDQALAANMDYQDDNEWHRFQDFDNEIIPTAINRLTRHRTDYQDQHASLKFERFDGTKPLYDPANLYPMSTRLIVTKKNSWVLGKIVSNIAANAQLFKEVPAIIIDDESDQASVNTIDPDKQKNEPSGESDEDKERRAINGKIVELLKLMPRAQYVGYTATPFANVFVDPSDPRDIYPKDFLISLPEPVGYMGVKDFHDLEPVPEPADASNSNYIAYVRDLGASEKADDADEREAELSRALDMFVLTGACKLYRADQPDVEQFKHHTMLIHESVSKASQKKLAEGVVSLWARAGFATPAGLKRLERLYLDDVLPVSKVRCESEKLALPEFGQIKAYIAKAVARITEHNNNPVLIVNSDESLQHLQQDLDFDKSRIWRVLVGGAKLSRGFTVEGLTVTYFRRSTRMSDSLTQMGRWFGFRHGYRDLVRLYIDRSAKFGKKKVDLYKAFEAVALDEAAFREQLARYAEWDGDKPKVTPMDIPPLVSQHLPWLKPTSRDKMFNAVLEEAPDRAPRPTGYPFELEAQRANLDLWRPLLNECKKSVNFPASGQMNLRAFSGKVSAERLFEIIDEMQWMYEYKLRWIEPRLNYMRRVLQSSGALEDFSVLLPQPGEQEINVRGVGTRKFINRDRRDRGGTLVQKFGEITDPKHRAFIRPLLAGVEPEDHPLGDLWSRTRGVCLVYLVKEQNPQFGKGVSVNPPAGASPERGLLVTFALYLPEAAIVAEDDVPKFRVLVPDELDDAGSPIPTVDEKVAKKAEAARKERR